MASAIVWRGSSDEYGSWNTICISPRASRSAAFASPVTSRPAIVTRPALGSISRSTSRATVDFPDPDSPTSPKVSPAAIAKSTPSTARTSPSWRRSTALRTGNALRARSP